jgi:hypothetical protein
VTTRSHDGPQVSLTVRCYRDRLAWLQGRNDKWWPDLFRVSFGFQCDSATNYVTQFIQTDFFSIYEPLEAPVRANEHVLITVAIPAERLINFGALPRVVADERIYWGVPVEVDGLVKDNSPLWVIQLADKYHLRPNAEQEHSIGGSGGDEKVCQVSLPGIKLGVVKQADHLFDPDKLKEWVGCLDGTSDDFGVQFNGQARFNFSHPLIHSVGRNVASRFWLDHAEPFASDDRTANHSQLAEIPHMSVVVSRHAVRTDGDSIFRNDAEDCRAAIRFHLNGAFEEMPNDSRWLRVVRQSSEPTCC